MSKAMGTDVVFKPTYNDNEGSSSDSEIEIIPYTKPPPVVIDLLESEKEDDEESEENAQKKKSKKKKSKRDKDKRCKRAGGENDDNSSTSCSASHAETESLQSLSQNQPNDFDSHSQSSYSSQAVEPVIEMTSNCHSNNLGSENVAGKSSNNTVAQGGNPRQSISNSSQSSRKDRYTTKSLEKTKKNTSHKKTDRREQCSFETALLLGTGTNMVGNSHETITVTRENALDSNISPSQHAQVTPNSGTKSKKVANTSNNGSNTPKRKQQVENGETRKGRRRTISNAAQRTNEEIINFLTTLGIPMEANAFDPPPKKKRLTRRSDLQVDADAAVTDNSDGNITVNTSASSEFVLVTQEQTGTPSKKGKSGKKRRLAVHGDLADCNVAFTNEDFNSVKTNFQSNLIIPNSNSPAVSGSSISAVIDSVAKRGLPLEQLIERIDPEEDEHVGRKSCDGNQKVTDESPATEEEIFGESCPASVTTSNNETEVNENENLPHGIPELPTVVSTMAVNESENQSSSFKNSIEINKIPESPGKENNSQTPIKINNLEMMEETETINIRGNVLSSSNRNETFSGLSIEASSKEQSNEIIIDDKFFPSTWTPEMREFYDTIRNENFELEDAYISQSDAPHMWETSEDLMPPPKPKRRIRCDRCKQYGHFKSECKEKPKALVCHMCGRSGHSCNREHSSRHSSSCYQAKCLNCGHQLKQYSQKCNYCLQQRHPTRCPVCNVVGHGKEMCPDVWRRFHSITSADQITSVDLALTLTGSTNWKHDKTYIRPSSMYCANCGKRGHSYYDCYGSKMHPYTRNKPYVVKSLLFETNNGSSNTSHHTSHVGASQLTKGHDKKVVDPEPGRAVVFNKNDQSFQEIETIQVKITNELATSSGHVATKKCQLEEGCTNMVKDNEQCVQSIVQDKAYARLLRAEEKGKLKELQEKYGVQICIIRGSCYNKYHLYGANSNKVNKELTLILWESPIKKQTDTNLDEGRKEQEDECDPDDIPRIHQNSGKEDESSSSSAVDKITPIPTVSPNCITLDDDDDDICVINEIPVEQRLAVNDLTPKANKDKALKKVAISKETSAVDSQHQAKKKQKTLETPIKPKKNDEIKTDNTKVSKSSSGENGTRSSLGTYESPLTGLPLSARQEKSRWENRKHNRNTNDEGNFEFNLYKSFQQLPPNPNPFFECNRNNNNPNPFDNSVHINQLNYMNPFIENSIRNDPWNQNTSLWDRPPNPMEMYYPQPISAYPLPSTQLPLEFPMQRSVQNDCYIAEPDSMTNYWTDVPSNNLDGRNVSRSLPVPHGWPSLKPRKNVNISSTYIPSSNPEDSYQQSKPDSIQSLPSALSKIHSDEKDQVEIITIDENSGDEECNSNDVSTRDLRNNKSSPRSGQSTSLQMPSQTTMDYEKVTLLQSEWKLVTDELMMSDNSMNYISGHFGVKIMAAKESPDFFIYISEGTARNRRFAKDNVIFWLGNKCANTKFRLLPNGNEDINIENMREQSTMENSGKRKRNLQNLLRCHSINERRNVRKQIVVRKRALNLSDEGKMSINREFQKQAKKNKIFKTLKRVKNSRAGQFTNTGSTAPITNLTTAKKNKKRKQLAKFKKQKRISSDSVSAPVSKKTKSDPQDQRYYHNKLSS